MRKRIEYINKKDKVSDRFDKWNKKCFNLKTKTGRYK